MYECPNMSNQNEYYYVLNGYTVKPVCNTNQNDIISKKLRYEGKIPMNISRYSIWMMEEVIAYAGYFSRLSPRHLNGLK